MPSKPKPRTTSVTSTLPPPPPSAGIGHARYPYSDVNRKHTRPSRTNDQIIADAKYGPAGIGIVTPSPLGSQSDRWTRRAGTTSTATSTPASSGSSGSGYFNYDNVPTGGGGGDIPGGGGGPTKIGWEEKYQVNGAPSWWKGLVPVGGMDPQSEYALLYNSLIPFMSPEDQRQAGANLFALYRDEPLFATYSLEKTPTPALGRFDQAPAPQYDYLTAQRAQNALDTLTKVREVMGKSDTDYGPGYQFLRNIATVLKNYGSTVPGDHQTRAQYLAQQGALDPLMAQAKSDALSAYGPIAQQLAVPFFSNGLLRDYGKDESGRNVFGRSNAALF